MEKKRKSNQLAEGLAERRPKPVQKELPAKESTSKLCALDTEKLSTSN
jgi:hypothetical protein